MSDLGASQCVQASTAGGATFVEAWPSSSRSFSLWLDSGALESANLGSSMDLDLNSTLLAGIVPKNTVLPTITSVSPSPGTISRSTAVTFRVTDDLSLLARVVISADYSSGATEVVHDGTSYQPGYSGSSSRSAVTGGLDFSVAADNGWFNSFALKILAVDTDGNTATTSSSLSYTVSDPGSAVDPALSSVTPTNASTIDRDDTIAFHLTHALGRLGRVTVSVSYTDGATEIVHDGSGFSSAFSGSRSSITNGFAYSFSRSALWPQAGVTIRILAEDTAGGDDVLTLSYTVSDPAGAVEPVVSAFDPTSGSTMSAGTSIEFDVTHDLDDLDHEFIYATFASGRSEVVFDGTSFVAPYSVERTDITDGHHFELGRSGGWPAGALGLTVSATDGAGHRTTASGSWTVTAVVATRMEPAEPVVAAAPDPMGAPPPREPTLFESDPEVTIGSAPISVLVAHGGYSACDVAFDVPGGLLGTCTVALYGIVGSARTLLLEAPLSDFDATVADGRATGHVGAVRGRPCEAFELQARTTGDDATGAVFFLRVWESLGAPSSALATPATSPGHRFSAATESISSAEGTGQASIVQLLHDGTRQVEIQGFTVSYSGLASTGRVTLRAARFRSEGDIGSGALVDAVALDGTTAAASVVRSGAAVSPDAEDPALVVVGLDGAAKGTFVWTAEDASGPIVLMPGIARGFAIVAGSEDGLDEPMELTASLLWTERAAAARTLAHWGFTAEWRADRGVTSGLDGVMWTDQIGGRVLVNTDAATSPSVGILGDGAVALTFEDSASQRLEFEGALFDPNEDYTIVALVKLDGSTSMTIFSATDSALAPGSGGSEIAVYNASTTLWGNRIKVGGTTNTAQLSIDQSIWRLVIQRRDGATLRTLVSDSPRAFTSSSAAITVGSLTVDRASLGSVWGSSHSAFLSGNVRHLAIRPGALSDEECMDLRSLLATYWPSLS